MMRQRMARQLMAGASGPPASRRMRQRPRPPRSEDLIWACGIRVLIPDSEES